MTSFGNPSTPLFNFYGSTADNCVVTLVNARRLTLSPIYTNGQSTCAYTTSGIVLHFNPKFTSGAVSGMTVKTIYAFLPEDLIGKAMTLLDTDASAEYVCDVLENKCADYAMFRERVLRGTKSRDHELRPKSGIEGSSKTRKKKAGFCLKTLKNLPLYEGKLNYIDGNSRGCRILHADFAKINQMHCPHVTFEKEPDMDGKVKCAKSEERQYDEIFEDWQLDIFRLAAVSLYGLDPDSFVRISTC